MALDEKEKPEAPFAVLASNYANGNYQTNNKLATGKLLAFELTM